jgi:SAM-dependent methyltransferase
LDAARLKAFLRAVHLRLPRPLFRLGARLAPALTGDENLGRIYREQLLIDQAVSNGRLGDAQTAGMSERVVEVPWVLRHAGSSVGRLLDVGTAHALDVYKRLLTRLPQNELHLLDLADVELRGAVFHRADLRATPFGDDYFDVAICISTLEHIGLDNSEYFSSDEPGVDQKGDVAALRELGRVTTQAGRVLLTVPGGQPGDYGWYRQYDAESFARLVAEAGLTIADVEYFVYDPTGGWRSADGAELEGLMWGAKAPFAAGLICASLQPASVPATAVPG